MDLPVRSMSEKIHKNCLINSLYGNFYTPVEVSTEEISPTGMGNVFVLPIGKKCIDLSNK